MSKVRTAIAAVILGALALVGVTPAQAAELVPVGPIPTPVQHDDCGPELIEGGGPNDYIGASFYHWTIRKVTGASASVQWFNDGSGYTVRYDAKPGYYIPADTQRVWVFPAFTNEPCEQ